MSVCRPPTLSALAGASLLLILGLTDIGLGVGICSASHVTSAEGAEPCCMVSLHGPAACGLVTT